MPISENIKRLREMYGLTQAELGEIAGVSDKAVSTWEAGTKSPRMGAIQRMADHFGIKKSDIIDDAGMKPEKRGIVVTDRDEMMMLSAYRGADPVYRTAALDILLAHQVEDTWEKMG